MFFWIKRKCKVKGKNNNKSTLIHPSLSKNSELTRKQLNLTLIYIFLQKRKEQIEKINKEKINKEKIVTKLLNKNQFIKIKEQCTEEKTMIKQVIKI